MHEDDDVRVDVDEEPVVVLEFPEDMSLASLAKAPMVPCPPCLQRLIPGSGKYAGIQLYWRRQEQAFNAYHDSDEFPLPAGPFKKEMMQTTRLAATANRTPLQALMTCVTWIWQKHGLVSTGFIGSMPIETLDIIKINEWKDACLPPDSSAATGSHGGVL